MSSGSKEHEVEATRNEKGHAHRQGRILVVDDDEKWRTFLSLILEQARFRVDTVGTSIEALECLRQKAYHLVVLDVRLRESDPANVEGMDLLREIKTKGLAEAMGIVMLSAYATVEQMRTGFREYSIRDFLSKDEFDSLEFPERVRGLFTENFNINLNLEIDWQQNSGPEQAVLDLSLGDERIECNTPLQKRVAQELDDLLCRLFYRADRLLVLYATAGSNRTGLLLVQPLKQTGAERTVVVKFGDVETIKKEYEKFVEYVQPFVRATGHTTSLDMRRTSLLGGIVYALGQADAVQTFGAFYRGADVPHIRGSLNNLFLQTCGAWYANPGALRLHDLSDDYQQHLSLKAEKLQKVFENLNTAQQGDRLYFRSLGNEYSFANPLRSIVDQPVIRSTYVCLTHGGINADNILIDDNGQTYLVDFARTGPSHILRDIAALDAMVRLRLLPTSEATLKERLRMEEALCDAERFSEIGQSAKGFLDSTENPSVIKAFSAAIHLRSLARQLVADNPRDDISELYVALFYYALDSLQVKSLSQVQRDHALLSASLLYEIIQGVFHRRYSEMEIESLGLRLQDKGRFQLLSIASHQLKTPLGNIHVILEDMKAGVYGEVNDKQELRLEQAIESVDREFKMIERMLDLTRAESGRVRPDLIPCNLLDCLRGAIDDNRNTLERKALGLKLELPIDGIRITGDSTLLTAAFSNVLENAVKFTERGEIGVRCQSEKGWVNIEIWDTGIGISEEALPHIFDNYFQADAGLARRFEGLGAGLPLAKEWLKLHGGTIEAKSAPEQGTIFLLRLPMHDQNLA